MPKTVGIGITGAEDTYKIADLVSRFRDNGLEVIIIMTEDARNFIDPLTFKVISGREVVIDLWAKPRQYKVQHLSVAEQLDLLLIAPATANIIAKLAAGVADDFLSTLATANTAPVLIVPAMPGNMYQNPAVQVNIKALQNQGYHFMLNGGIAEGNSELIHGPDDIDAICKETIKIISSQSTP